MRVVGYILLAIVCLYGIGLGALFLYQRRLIYPGAFEAIPHDPTAPAGATIVTLRTGDGETLHALWSAPKPGCGLVLSFHGNGSFPEQHAARFAASPWREAGWGYLAIAYRGYPGSSGTPSESGLIEDARTAYRYASREAPDASILLHGHSLGAAVAVALAEDVPHVGLYLEAPFDSMDHLVRLLFPLVPSSLLRDSYRSDARVRSGSTPILIVHGIDDDIVPAKLGMKLAGAAGRRARIEVVPADHVSVIGSRDAEAEPYFRGLLAAPRTQQPDTLVR